jgi:hypothetical protein
MGGSAAIQFAQRIKANLVLAFSPQFDIAAPWDRRWAEQAAQLGPMRLLTRDLVQPGCRYVIAYDPQDADRTHFRHFAKVLPAGSLQGLALPYAGHPVGHFLLAAGVLKEVVGTLLAGHRPGALAATLRRKRSAYPNYFFGLAGHCLRRRKLRWGADIIARAIKLAPYNAEYHIRAAQIAEARNNQFRAISFTAMAVALAPQHPHMNAMLARLLHGQGLHAQALHHMEAALRALPEAEYFISLRDEIRRALGLDA